MDQFTEKNQGLESVLFDFGQRINNVERAGQPVGKLEAPSDSFFAVLEDTIAEKAPPLPARSDKKDGGKGGSGWGYRKDGPSTGQAE